MLADVSPSADQIWRVKAATDVFPLVPVTAAITSGWRGKNFAAASAKARRALPTRMKATPSGSGIGGTRSAMMAAAPAAKAGPTKRKPSSLLPATATNRSPDLIVRLSALTPAILSAAKRASLTASTGSRLLSCMSLSIARAVARRRTERACDDGASYIAPPTLCLRLSAAGARQDQLLGRRQLEAWLEPEQGRNARDDGAADRHRVP